MRRIIHFLMLAFMATYLPINVSASVEFSDTSPKEIMNKHFETAKRLYSLEKEIVRELDSTGRYIDFTSSATDLYEDVITILEVVLNYDPDHVGAHLMLGNVYYEKMNAGEGHVFVKYYEKSLRHFNQAINVHSASIDSQELVEAEKKVSEMKSLSKETLVE